MANFFSDKQRKSLLILNRSCNGLQVLIGLYMPFPQYHEAFTFYLEVNSPIWIKRTFLIHHHFNQVLN